MLHANIKKLTGDEFNQFLIDERISKTAATKIFDLSRMQIDRLCKSGKKEIPQKYLNKITGYYVQKSEKSNIRKVLAKDDFNNSKQSGNIVVTTHENEKFANSIEGYIKAINILNKKIDKLESEKDLLLDTNAKLTNHIEWLTTLTAKKNTKPH